MIPNLGGPKGGPSLLTGGHWPPCPPPPPRTAPADAVYRVSNISDHTMSRHDSESVSSAGTEISVSLDEGNRYIYIISLYFDHDNSRKILAW